MGIPPRSVLSDMDILTTNSGTENRQLPTMIVPDAATDGRAADKPASHGRVDRLAP
jgi:hypothetical protein